LPDPEAEAAPAGKIKLLMVYNGGHDFHDFQRTLMPVLEKTGALPAGPM
jgi:hypothetical protein